MKIAHLSDTHLGYNGFGRQPLVPDPSLPNVQVRQQEADLMLGLKRAVDLILQRKPDLVIHTGDLFDAAHPSPRNIAFAQQQLWRLGESQITTVLIEGDHSCPRSAKDGHVLSLFERIPNLHVVFRDAKTVLYNGIAIHALSHQTLARDGLPLARTLTGADGHILATHTVADGHHFFKTGRAACEAAIAESAHQYRYIALGHSHRFAQVPHTDTAFYAGSTAPVMPNDFTSTATWSINLVEISDRLPHVERVFIESRPVNFYGLSDASGLSAAEILSYLSAQTTAVSAQGAYCNLVIEQMEAIARRDLSMRDVEDIFSGFAGFRHQFHTREHKTAVRGWAAEAYEDRFERILNTVSGTPAFKKDVRDLGLQILENALQTAATSADEPDMDED